jgi:L-fuconate dehydratase
VIHLAASAILNAIWDLLANKSSKPLWKYLLGLTPEQIVSTIDFTYM